VRIDRAYVYMMSNKRYGTIYVGVTNNIVRRAWEHREGVQPGFTRTYGLKLLVWYEEHASIIDSARAQHEALAAPLENQAHRRDESGLGRPVFNAGLNGAVSWVAGSSPAMTVERVVLKLRAGPQRFKRTTTPAQGRAYPHYPLIECITLLRSVSSYPSRAR